MTDSRGNQKPRIKTRYWKLSYACIKKTIEYTRLIRSSWVGNCPIAFDSPKWGGINAEVYKTSCSVPDKCFRTHWTAFHLATTPNIRSRSFSGPKSGMFLTVSPLSWIQLNMFHMLRTRLETRLKAKCPRKEQEQRFRPGRASPGKISSYWWYLWVTHFRQSLNANDFQPSIECLRLVICPITFGPFKWGVMYTKGYDLYLDVNTLKYPKKLSLHFNVIFLVSFWCKTTKKSRSKFVQVIQLNLVLKCCNIGTFTVAS